MLSYEFTPERGREDCPMVQITWDGGEDFDIYEHVEKFKIFLRAMSFTDSVIDKITVVEDNDKFCCEKSNEG